jgi:hypothetical protein
VARRRVNADRAGDCNPHWKKAHVAEDKLVDGALQAEWHKIAKTLPAGADHAYARHELERIKRDYPAKRRAEECTTLADWCTAAIEKLPDLDLITDRPALEKQLLEQSRELREKAKYHRRVWKANEDQLRRSQQFDALWLWERLGGDLHYRGLSSKSEDGKWVTGAVTNYLVAISTPVFGNPVAEKTASVIVSEYNEFHLSSMSMAGNATMLIAEDGVFLIRDGRVIDKDGNDLGPAVSAPTSPTTV